MKKTLFVLVILFKTVTCIAQSSNGLLAHWDMNGEVNDVSGNGHNGTANNLTPDTGINGLPNSAYYFNGINSVITAPYLPDLNVTKYSICAIIKVKGFYRGTCQGNWILSRGAQSSPGSYICSFSNSYYDSSCYIVDSAEDFFSSNLGTNGAADSYEWVSGQPIIKNKWYKLVITYDSIQWKVFINDTLTNTIVNASGTTGTSTDSLSLGMNIFGDAAAFPFNFKGVMDDIQLYNRVLSDSEILHLGDTCGAIISQPTASHIDVGSNAIYTVNSSITTATYQWQQNSGLGFVNLYNAGPYSGTTTNTLTITGVTSVMNNDYYRCIVTNSWGCTDTSSQALLTATTSVNNTVLNNEVLIYPNTVKNNIFIQLPYNNSEGNIELANEIGQVLLKKPINNKITEIGMSDLKSGIYILRITLDGQVIYRKVLKN